MDTTLFDPYYSSQNSAVIDIYRDNDNTHMFLAHYPETQDNLQINSITPDEYIIGSYFSPTVKDDVILFEWTWGHYFNNLADAYAFWEKEVLPHGEPT